MFAILDGKPLYPQIINLESAVNGTKSDFIGQYEMRNSSLRNSRPVWRHTSKKFILFFDGKNNILN